MSEGYTCPNCEALNSKNAVFCQNCSQKIHLKLNSVWRMIGTFFATLIDYDSKLFSSVRGLFRPGYLTNQYLLRKRVKYLTPIRLFVILMFSFFWVMANQGYDEGLFKMNLQSSNGIEEGETIENKYYTLMEQGYQSLRFDLLLNLLEKEFKIKSSKINKSIELLNKKLMATVKESDKENILSNLKTKRHELTQVESAQFSFNNMQSFIDNKKEKIFNIKFATVTYQVDIHDVSNLSSEELVEKYAINHWLDKIIIVQMLKFNSDTEAFRDFIFKNLTWVVILDLLIMSAVYKLFYLRTKRKYVEHFIYNLNSRSWLFFIGIVLMLLPVINQTLIILIIVSALSLFLILSLKNVYQQSIAMTTIKFIVLTVFNLIVLLIAMLLVILVSSLLF
jgi:hypothetical protein